MSERWRIELFARLRARRGDREISSFRKQKVGSLLAYLAYRPFSAHPREAIVEALWPGAYVETGRNNLRSILHALREQLEPGLSPADSLLIGDRSTVSLRPGAFTTDVAEWEAALADAVRAPTRSDRIARLAHAIDLYQGELLSGCYDDWILTERQRRAEEHVRALQELATALEQAGDLEGAIGYARRAVGADPLREELHCALMRLYAAAGQPSTTWRQYQELERILREEMGETPAAATRALAEELCEQARAVAVARSGRLPELPAPGSVTPSVGDPKAAPPTAPTLPGPPSHPVWEEPRLPLQLSRFFGREEEIARLTRLLGSGETRLVTLTGPGGSGKTRLAIAVAGRLQERFGDAVAFVSLADLIHAARIPDAVADALGLTCSPTAELLERLVAHLRGRPWLQVLDNVEHVAEEAAPLVRRLLQRIPTLTLLVTSRQRLRIDGEQEFALLPLPTPRRSDPPERLMDYASVQLFVDRARAVRPDFRVTASNAAAVAELCDRLDGLPLALELAAARAHILSPSQMLAHLERRFDFLVSRQRDGAARHRTLRAALDGSYQLLSPELRQFFAGLSVFRGGWTLEAAEQVAAAPSPRSARAGTRTAASRRSAVDSLTELRECSLILSEEAPLSVSGRGAPPRSGRVPALTATEGAGGQRVAEGFRYRLLETLQEYAAEQLAAEDGEALRRRHALYFLSLAEQTEATLPGGSSRTGVERLESELLNLRAALAWSLADDQTAELALRLVCRLRPLWQKRMTEGREWLAAALTRTRHASPALRAEALHLAAMLAGLQNDLPAAGTALEESLALRRAVGDRAGVADVLVDLAVWARGREDHAAAKAFLEECVLIRRELDDRPGVAWAIENLAWTAQQGGESALARSLLQESLAIGRECGFPAIVAYTLHGLGWLAALQGDLAGARPLLQEGLEAARELARHPEAASPPSALRRIWREVDPDGARFMLEQSLAFSRTLGQQWLVMHHLGALGHVARRQGDYEQCAAYYRESLLLRREGGDLFAIAQSLEDIAGLAGRQDRHERAARLLGAADALCQEIGKRLPVAVPEEYEHTTRRARAILGEEAFAAAWEQGRATPLEQAIEVALREAAEERFDRDSGQRRGPDPGRVGASRVPASRRDVGGSEAAAGTHRTPSGGEAAEGCGAERQRRGPGPGHHAPEGAG